jgi:hypothetical protein
VDYRVGGEGPRARAAAGALDDGPGCTLSGALALCSGRLVARLEVDAEEESDAARLAAARFVGALEKASLELLPHIKRLESRRRLRRRSELDSNRGWAGKPAVGHRMIVPISRGSILDGDAMLMPSPLVASTQPAMAESIYVEGFP